MNQHKQGLPMVKVSIEQIMESEIGDLGYMEIDCPYLDCGSIAHAEPDAQITCCLDCGRQFNLNTPI